MSTLLLRLAAPLQSWGAYSRFNRRTTEREPTKSGVIGLVAAALGRRRTDSIDDLRELAFGVRIDQRGSLLHDFHTAHTESGQAFTSDRYYLEDAVFLVGLEGDEKLLSAIDAAVRSPVFPLFLGRRSCPPTGRLSPGIRDSDLSTALRNEPWQASPWYQRRRDTRRSLEFVRDDYGDGAVFALPDNPLSFNQQYRQYAYRGTVRGSINIAGRAETEHDPFNALAAFETEDGI
ncbi:MAG: type I-E CRISPR-associated protein Cas5/CasD [Oscillospiraceae bacterium]|jgi:CRISPR system Cascade subunit CasD|nr:type I-E CRISPR-associated protein Cas5/CasD [Oscillospiraceae bacterium]